MADPTPPYNGPFHEEGCNVLYGRCNCKLSGKSSLTERVDPTPPRLPNDLELLLADLREAGADKRDSCGVHEQPRWTCAFCLYRAMTAARLAQQEAERRADEFQQAHAFQDRLTTEYEEKLSAAESRLTEARQQRDDLILAMKDAGITEGPLSLRWIFQLGLIEVASSGGLLRSRVAGLLIQVRNLIDNMRRREEAADARAEEARTQRDREGEIRDAAVRRADQILAINDQLRKERDEALSGWPELGILLNMGTDDPCLLIGAVRALLERHK